jgi:hypothetical protein
MTKLAVNENEGRQDVVVAKKKNSGLYSTFKGFLYFNGCTVVPRAEMTNLKSKLQNVFK